MTKKVAWLASEIQEFNDIMDNKFTEWKNNLEEITKNEIDNLINNPTRNSLYDYLNNKFLDLQDLVRNPDTFKVCWKLFNQILKSLIANEDTKKLLLSWKKWTKMFVFRDEILLNYSSIIDNEVVTKLKKYTKDEEKIENFGDEEDDEI